MGGELEQKVSQTPPEEKKGETVPQKPPDKETVIQAHGFKEVIKGPQTGQDLRFHIANGEVHFHDDQLKLKAAMSVADYYNALQRVLKMETVCYLDLKFETLLKLTPYLQGDNVEVYGELSFARPGKMLRGMVNLKK